MSRLLILATLFNASCGCGATSSGNSEPVAYDDPVNWAALPNRSDNADLVPDDAFHDGQESAAIDVFYVHPTTAYSFLPGNAALDDASINAITDSVLRTQATAFNGTARVYAPRYRQATLGAWLAGDLEGSLTTAYQSLAAAFDYYLDHHNNGRGIILAGHSQGSQMIVRLLRARFDGDQPAAVALRARLIVAYIIGEKVGESQFTSISPSSSPTDTGTFVSWATFFSGTDPADSELLTGDASGPNVCVNPLTFTRATALADNAMHRGSVVEQFNQVYPNFISAQCQNGYLFISNPSPASALNSSNFPNEDGDHHESDYTLFWVNLRENVAARAATYSSSRSAK